MNDFWNQREPPTDALRRSIRDTYKACSAGTGTPETIDMGGSMLNILLETDEYDPCRWYRVSADSITLID